MRNLLLHPETWGQLTNIDISPESSWTFNVEGSYSADENSYAEHWELEPGDVLRGAVSYAVHRADSWSDTDLFFLVMRTDSWDVVFSHRLLAYGEESSSGSFELDIDAYATSGLALGVSYSDSSIGTPYGYSGLGSLTIEPPPPPPPELIANDDDATTPMNTPVTVPVLANDTLGDEPVALADLDGPPTIHVQPANGTVEVGADGRITYTPNPGFTGTDEFVYRIAIEHQPDPINICAHLGEAWDIYSQFDGIFDKNLPIRVDSNNGGCATLNYFSDPSSGYWQVNYGGSECPEPFYPDVGEIVTVSQGDVSIEGKIYETMGIMYNGGYWEINHPWWGLDPYTELLFTYEGESYRGMVDDSGTTIHWDNPPPSPQGSGYYIAEIMYTSEAGESTQCVLVTRAAS